MSTSVFITDTSQIETSRLLFDALSLRAQDSGIRDFEVCMYLDAGRGRRRVLEASGGAIGARVQARRVPEAVERAVDDARRHDVQHLRQQFMYLYIVQYTIHDTSCSTAPEQTPMGIGIG